MKNDILFLIFIVLFINACQATYTSPDGSYPAIESYNGNVNEKDVTEGLKLKKKYSENTEYVADYIVSSYKFDYYADNVSEGNPVGVKEDIFEKYTTVSDHVKFRKLAYFNDQINFDGYWLRSGTKQTTNFYKSDYVITNFQSGGIFYSDAKQAQIAIDLNVVGSILRLNYSRYYKDAKYLTSAYFLDGFPQKEKVITFAIPSYLNVEIIEKNFEGFNIEKSDNKYVINDDQIKSRLDAGKSKDKEKVNYITYILKDSKAIKNEKNAPGGSFNLPHIVILVKSIDYDKAKAYSKPIPKEIKVVVDKNVKSKVKNKTVTKKVVTELVPLIANTTDLYKHYAQIVSLVENDSTVLIEKVKAIVSGKTTDLEKIEAVFYWVQDNIRYVAFEDGIAGFKPDACQNVFNNRFGDCKGMANLLKSMLKTLGYDARLTWIGTKHLNYGYNVPSILVDNHMICTLILNGKKYFLDGTESFISIDDYADRIQGMQVMVQNGADYIIDTIPDLPIERNTHLRKATFSLNDNIFEGRMFETIKGENKTDILRAFHNSPLDKKGNVLLDVIDPDDIDIDASNIKSTDLKDRRNDINLEYDLTVNNHLLTIGNTIMLKPDFNREFSASKTDSTRFFDIQYDHKINYEYDLTFQIPAGFKVISTPQNIIIDNPEFSVVMKYVNDGNSLRYTKSIKIKKGKISKSNFKQWNEMIDKLRVNYNQYVVLNK